MNQTSEGNVPPTLAAPGAGLPWMQKLFLKLYLGPFVAAKTPWEKSRQSFERTTSKILKEVESVDLAQMSQKVLVPRLPGLEDSSRYWSLAMTVEHLVIVGREIQKVVELLSRGQVPSQEADIRKVKPLGDISAQEALNSFRKFAFEEFPALRIQDPDSKLKFSHPWFGPFTAQQWYWLAGVHQGLHLRQLREIKKALKL